MTNFQDQTTLRMFHTHKQSDASSLYSTVLSMNDSIDDPPLYTFPTKNPQPDPYKVSNPYADSLWYKTRGESGNETIGDIQKRAKRKLEDNIAMKLPPRLESLGTKKVDSPIRMESFFNGFEDVHCDSPKYKGLDKVEMDSTPETRKYRQAFKELITTEQQYHDDLRLTETVYRSMLKNSKKYKYIISNRQESAIFSNMETISDLSGLFLRDITKAMSLSCHLNGNVEFEIEKHLNLVDIQELDIGDYLKNYFIRLKIAYSSYYQNHKTQMEELEQCEQTSGPKVGKWLNECAYLARSKSDCWNLESLLIKPIQRLPKYLLMIDVLLENSEEMPYEFVEHLYDAKSYLEKSLDGLNSKQVYTPDTEKRATDGSKTNNTVDLPIRDPKSYIGRFFNDTQVNFSSPTKDLTPSVKPIFKQVEEMKQKQERSIIQLKESRQEYVELVNDFKKMYANLKALRKEMKQACKPLFKFVDYHKELSEKWRFFMEYEDSDADDHYIKSIYSSYSEKVSDQRSKTKLLNAQIDERIVKAIDMSLECCFAVKYRIKKHNSNRGAYVRYLKGQGHITETVKLEAQEYIVIENQIKDDLPPLLEKLSSFIHYISMLYVSLFQDWLKMMAGSSQLEQYQQLLQYGELQRGDNFDIIEMYSISKQNTKTALKDMCSSSSTSSAALSHSSDYDTSMIMKIHTSKVVRRLFGF